MSKEFQELYESADAAGKIAVEKAIAEGKIVGMVVSDGRSQYHVADGVCGFAWVEVRPGNSKFANWLKKTGLGRYSQYDRCVTIWVSDYSQSLQKKQIYARAFAEVLQHQLFSNPLLKGVRVCSCSRMD